MTMCAERSLVKSGYLGTEIVTLFCKRWSCPVCAPKNRARVRAAITGGRPNKFVTFTCRPDESIGPARLARRMKTWVRQVFEEWRRRNPRAVVEWFAVTEAHKSGWPHIHVAARAPFLDWRELRAIWQERSGSFVVDIRRVQDLSRHARYLSKYLTKEDYPEGWGKRHWCSQGWDPEPSEEPLADRLQQWGSEIVDGAASVIAAAYRRLGWKEDEARGSAYYRMVAPAGAGPLSEACMGWSHDRPS